MSMEKNLNKFLEELIQEVEKDLDEATATGNVAGYNVPGAFSNGGSKDKKRKKKISTQFGMKIVGKMDEDLNEGYGSFIKAKNLTDIVALSKKKKNATFYVTDDNNSRIGTFYLKNGKFAKATSANPNYDFQSNKTKLKDRSDVIYKYKVDESVKEASFRPNSGTMSGGTYGLDNRKYQLKRDVKGVRIGDYTNVILPKGTIIYNIPGGVFAHHDVLAAYQSGQNKYFNKPTFKGISIRREKNVILSIEKNSKILESVITEKQFKGLDGIDDKTPLTKISDTQKLKIIQSTGNIISFFVPKGFDRNFWQVISKGKIKKGKSLAGDVVYTLPGKMIGSPQFKSIKDLIKGVDWVSVERARRFNESINEAMKPSQVRSAISKVKKGLMRKWKQKGGYENFGQKELDQMKSKFDYNPYGSSDERQISKMLDGFDNWAMNYDGNMRESVNEAKVKRPVNRWLELKNDETMHPHKKMAMGLKELKYQLRETQKFFNWYGKIKSMNELDSSDYWKRTNKHIYNIKERLINIARTIQEIEK